MKEFNYYRPESLREASQLLSSLGEESKLIAGGTALLLVMRQRMLNPQDLISIEKLPELSEIHIESDWGISIGALCTHDQIAQSELIRENFPIISSMASRVANPQVRNQGTLGGNICYADPSTDPPTCLLSLDAVVVLESNRGTRELPLNSFLTDYFTTDLKHDEILVRVRIPFLKNNFNGIYYRHLKTEADHRPILNFSLLVSSFNDECTHLKLAVGASLPVAKRIPEIETLLSGKIININLINSACEILVNKYDFLSDFRADDSYRKKIAESTLKRQLLQVFGQW